MASVDFIVLSTGQAHDPNEVSICVRVGDYFDIVVSLPVHSFIKHVGICPSLNELTRSLSNCGCTESDGIFLLGILVDKTR